MKRLDEVMADARRLAERPAPMIGLPMVSRNYYTGGYIDGMVVDPARVELKIQRILDSTRPRKIQQPRRPMEGV